FCMCPGGVIVPACTEKGHQVVNGMSSSSRSGRYANSAIVTEIRRSDIEDQSPFGVMRFIEEVERKSYIDGFRAPGVRMMDFIEGRASSSLPDTSYPRGAEPYDLSLVFPSFVVSALRSGLDAFNRMSRGLFGTNDALLLSAETRTSSPVRIPRDEGFMQMEGLFPAGEGAGYAGGIVSAAIDGTEAALSLIGRIYG
ncbi:MAG: FAD-binding protein, partial [Candidatus Ornithospirochaeta sp.]|nr:FAD-binding protein [Candidatus Ornithospirochaeta sp.]